MEVDSRLMKGDGKQVENEEEEGVTRRGRATREHKSPDGQPCVEYGS